MANFWEDGNPDYWQANATRATAPRRKVAPAAAALAVAAAAPVNDLFAATVDVVQRNRDVTLKVSTETGEVINAGTARRVFKNTAPQPVSCAPLSNTGAHPQNSHEATIDYVTCTFHGENAQQAAMDTFGPGLEWQDQKRGGYRYANCVKRGDVAVYFGGEYNDNGNMVPHKTATVVVSGKGCRQLEYEKVVQADPLADELGELSGWQRFLGELLEAGCTFPRLDTAIDDREGMLDLDVIDAAVNGGLCCTKFRQYERKTPLDIGTGAKMGDSCIFGNRQSLMFVRIYNKYLEQLVKGELGEGTSPFHWIRAEVEAHNEKALALAKAIFQYGTNAIAGALWKVVDFKDEDGNFDKEHKYMRKTVDWWSKFIDRTSKLPLTLAPRIRSVEQAFRWCLRQVAPVLAMLDAVPDMPLVHMLLEDGGKRLGTQHFAMLKQLSEREFGHDLAGTRNAYA